MTYCDNTTPYNAKWHSTMSAKIAVSSGNVFGVNRLLNKTESAIFTSLFWLVLFGIADTTRYLFFTLTLLCFHRRDYTQQGRDGNLFYTITRTFQGLLAHKISLKFIEFTLIISLSLTNACLQLILLIHFTLKRTDHLFNIQFNLLNTSRSYA